MFADKLNIVIDSNNLASRVGFDISLRDLSRFVIEKSVRISSPSYTPHVHPKFIALRSFMSLLKSWLIGIVRLDY